MPTLVLARAVEAEALWEAESPPPVVMRPPPRVPVEAQWGHQPGSNEVLAHVMLMDVRSSHLKDLNI